MTHPAPGDGSTGSIGATGWARTARVAASTGLGRRQLWPLALVAFLLRGGLVLYLAPIVVVPSTVGLATFIGPTAITPAGPSEAFGRLLAGVLAGLVAWLVGGGLAAAAAEVALIERALPLAIHPAAATRVLTVGLAARVLLIRLVVLLPLVGALAWGLPRIVGAAYRELTLPVDTASPVAFRVLRDVPEVLLLVLLAWLIGETVGGIAVRRIVLFGETGAAALLGAFRHVVRRPATTLATIAVAACGSAVLVVPGLVAAGLAWQRLGRALAAGSDPVAIALLTSLFVAAWLLGLVLAGAAAAWRSLAWTLEVRRTR